MSETQLSKEAVLKSIVPDSSQFNAEDCIAGPMTMTVESVTKGTKEQPVNIHMVGHERVFRPCKTARRVLITVLGDTPHDWVGHQMTIYCDPNVRWGNVKVGGLRISHLSGIKEPKTFLLTKSRGKKAEVTILPIQTKPAKPPTEEEQKLIAAYTDDITNAATLESLNEFGQLLADKPQSIRDALRTLYKQRTKELTTPPETEEPT